MAMFHLRGTSDGEFYFVVYAKAGPRLLKSPVFSTKDLASNAIEACRRAAPFDPRYIRLESEQRRPYFDMISLADDPLGTSELFSSPEAREETILYCRARIPLAGAIDETIPLHSQ